MQISLRVVIIGASAALAFPGAAEAAGFKDRVITGGAIAHTSQVQGATQRWPAGDTTIPVTIANSFKGDPNVAGTYAAFLGTLPHGAELASLKVIVVPAAEINSDCGGEDGDGILACYSSDEQTMIVPGDSSGSDDVSVNYVIAHEYGHHVARHRSNAPLPAIDFGPKRWSSYELVCDKADKGKVAPGDEGRGYAFNPGEAWAETYARLVFPLQAWQLASILKPDQGSYLAASADVLQPWTQRVSTTFSGSRGLKAFKLPITLDGAFTLQLSRKPKNLVVKSGGQVVERLTGRKRLHYKIACRDKQTEMLRIYVRGTGAYTLKASYAG
jgi:hypothetical protein